MARDVIGKQFYMKNQIQPLMKLGRLRLLQVTHLAIIILIAMLASLRYILTDFEQVPVPAILVVVACVANTIYVSRNGSLEIASWVLIVLLTLGLAYGGINTYGFDGPVVMLAPLIPVFAMLIINIRGACISLLLIGVVLAGLYFLNLSDIVPYSPYPESQKIFARFITILSTSLVSAIIVWRFAHTAKILMKELEQNSQTDFLTGVLNRRGIDTMLGREVGRAQRNDSWVSIILMDVDHFKRFNDINGHQAGDDCLVEIVGEIEKCINRKTDTLGRFGGEEFLVILPETDSSGATRIADYIRQSISKLGILYDPHHQDSVTLTLGVATGRGSEIESNEQFINLADQALYQGKQQGRNQVIANNYPLALDIPDMENDSLKGDRGIT